MSNVEIIKYKTSVVTNNKESRRDIIFIRIGMKSPSSYIKATTQFNLRVLSPLIEIHKLSSNFLNSISTYIIEAICWSEDESINDPEINKCILHGKLSLIDSKYSSTLPDNTHVLQSKYLILDIHIINTSTLKDYPLDIIYLEKNLKLVEF